MTIRTDSYSSTSEVKAYTRHLLNGQTAFNSTTRPTATDLEKMIDRVSGVLNNAILAAGFSPTTIHANSTAKLACDDFVTVRAVEYVELTQRGTGYSEQDGSRVAGFRNLYKSASSFVSDMRLGFIEGGIAQSGRKASDGLQFTGLTAQGDRTDKDDNTLEQPLFTRHLFDEPTVAHFSPDEQDDE